MAAAKVLPPKSCTDLEIPPLPQRQKLRFDLTDGSEILYQLSEYVCATIDDWIYISEMAIYAIKKAI